MSPALPAIARWVGGDKARFYSSSSSVRERCRRRLPVGLLLHSGIAQACFSSSLLGVGAHEVLLLEGSPEPQWKWDSVTGVGGMP